MSARSVIFVIMCGHAYFAEDFAMAWLIIWTAFWLDYKSEPTP